MTSAKDYQQRLATILGDSFQSGRIAMKLSWETVPEAKQHVVAVRMMQKELRLLKKDIANAMKEIRSAFTAEKAKVGKGFGSAVAAGLFGKKSVGRSNSVVRENLRRQQETQISPYESVSRLIDQSLLELDRAKLQLDTWISQNKT